MFFVWRCLTISSLEHQINEDIRDKEVRLIDADGNQVGIVPIAKALDAAAAKNLDLEIFSYFKYLFLNGELQ